MDILHFVQSISKEILELDKRINLIDNTDELIKSWFDDVIKNKGRFDWAVEDFIKVLKSNLFDNLKNKSIIKLVVCSLCISLSKHKKFIFGDEILNIVNSIPANYFLFRNSKRIIINSRKVPSLLAVFMKDGEIIFEYDIERMYIKNIEKGKFKIKKCNELILMNVYNAYIKIDMCDKLKFDLIYNSKIFIGKCDNLLGEPNEIKNSEIIINLKMFNNTYLPLKFTDKFFDEGDLIVKKTFLSKFMFGKNFYLRIVWEIHSFFKKLHPKLQTKVVPALRLKSYSKSSQKKLGSYDIKKKEIIIYGYTFKKGIIRNIIIHEYIHHLLNEVFTNSNIIQLNLSNVIVEAILDKSIEYKILKKFKGNIVAIVEGLVDFLAEFYCEINNIPIYVSYIEYKGRIRSEFMKQFSWRDFFNLLKNKKSEKEFWERFFNKVLGKPLK